MRIPKLVEGLTPAPVAQLVERLVYTEEVSGVRAPPGARTGLRARPSRFSVYPKTLAFSQPQDTEGKRTLADLVFEEGLSGFTRVQ